jgi:hypothetical protein
MNGAPLNTQSVGAVGLALLTTSCGALGKLIVDGSTCGAHLLLAPVALCFVGIAVAGTLCYLGRPATVKP